LSSRDLLMSANRIYWFADLGSVANNETGTGICVDSAGNVYVAATQVISGVSSWVVTKYADDASIAWQKQISGTASIVASACHGVSINGTYIYVTGVVNDKAVIVRLANDGSIIWQRQYNSILPGGSFFPSIDAAAGKNTVAKSDGSVYFVYNGYYTALGGFGIIIVRFDSSGTLLWEKVIPNPGGSPFRFNRPFGMVDTGDPSQGVYFANAERTNDSFSPNCRNDIYELASNGVNFSRSSVNLIGSKLLFPGDCASYYSAPSTYQAYMAFPATNQFPGTVNDVYVVSYIAPGNSVGGSYAWAVRTTNYPAPVSDVGCLTDQYNNLYVGATSNNTVYIIKYNSSGVLQWQRSLSNPSGYSVSLDSLWADTEGSVYVCGFTTVVSQSANTNIFVAKIPNDGSLTGTYNLGAVPNGSIVYQASSLTVLTGQFLTQAATTGTLASLALGSGTSTASISASALPSTVRII